MLGKISQTRKRKNSLSIFPRKEIITPTGAPLRIFEVTEDFLARKKKERWFVISCKSAEALIKGFSEISLGIV